MNKKPICTLLTLLAATAVGISNAPAAAPKAALPPLSQAGQNLETQYAEQLKALRAEIEKSLPKVDEQNIIALQKARDAVTVAQAQAKAAQEALGKVNGAKGLVEHAKGKWIGGAEKGIAQAEAALKNAKTDAERDAAQKELAKLESAQALQQAITTITGTS